MSWDATYSIASRRADVAAFADVFESFCISHGVETAVMRAFQVAFDEWLTNVVDYAHEGRHEVPIEVALAVSPDRLSAEISDRGDPFDPLNHSAEPSLNLDVEDRPIGGLGIHLIRTLMDDLVYRREQDRNILRMTKHRPSSTA